MSGFLQDNNETSLLGDTGNNLPLTHAPSRSIFCRLSLSSVIIIAYALLLLVIGGGPQWALTLHEVRVAQPAREMLHDGHWILPSFAGKPRLVKPPTTSWVVASILHLTGRTDEWIVRLPANLMGVGLALLTGCLTARWLGEFAGCIAGLIQITTYYILLQARLAEADIFLAAMVGLAMVCFAWGVVPNSDGHVSTSRWLSILFYVAAAWAFLFKGPIGPAFIFLGCTVYLILQRDRRGLGFLCNAPGLAAFFLIALPWPIAAYLEYPPILEIWKHEIFGRAAGELGRSDSFFSYFWNIPMMLMPWTPLVIVGIIAGWRLGWWRKPIGRFLAAWFLAGMLVILLCAWKHKHYAIPILPPLTIPAAGCVLLWISRTPPPNGRCRHGLIAAGFLIACVATVTVILCLNPAGTRSMALLGIPLACGGLAVIGFDHCRRPVAILVSLFATAAVLILGVERFVLPHYDLYRPSAELGQRIARDIPRDQTIYLLSMGEAQISYYIPFPMFRIDNLANIPEEVATIPSQTLYVVGPRYAIDALGPFGQLEILDRANGLRRRETERDRITFARLIRSSVRSPPVSLK
jgi:4-amino-4-deoxy-L-arabinose transferase-like glycosyltransferase